MKDVVISIRGIQRSFHPGEEEQGPESVELVTDGRYEYGRDASWFTYQESEITGMEGTVTTFRVEDGAPCEYTLIGDSALTIGDEDYRVTGAEALVKYLNTLK